MTDTELPTDTGSTAPSWSDSPEVEERVEALLAQMTLEEKASFLTGGWNFDFGFYGPPITRLNIPALQMADGPAGVRINKGEVNGGAATALPAPIALAATWDPRLAQEYGALIGAECRATNHNISLGPGVDIARVPTGGRTFESFGEDPLLTSDIGVEVVRGIQSQGVQACAKHYAMNNQEQERFFVSADLDERTMMEIYLSPFEALVREGEVASIMASFNRINGVHACEHQELLLDVLRDRFGFRGWVMSDFGANHSTVDAVNAGLDNEQPGQGHWGSQLVDAVRNGEIAEGALDGKVRNILRPLIGLGQVENPVGITEFDEDGHHAVAQRIAENAMVVLRNDGVLPLTGAKSVALIGPDVDAISARGGGSSMVRPTRRSTPLDGLARELGSDVKVEVAYGVDPITPGALLHGPDPIPSGFFRTPDGHVGLRGEYWTNTDFDGDPIITRTDSQVDLFLGFFNYIGFNGCSERYEPLPTDLNSHMSARWSGTLIPPIDGTYTICLSVLGEVRMYVDGELVLDSVCAESDDAPTAATPKLAAAVGSESGYGDGQDADHEIAGIESQFEHAVELAGGHSYALRIEYKANHPSQVFRTGARIRLAWLPPAGTVAPAVAEAAALAARSDVAIIVLRSYESEAADRPHMHLPNGQDALVREVLKANSRTVVVLMTGAPVAVNAWGGEPAALIQSWYAGQGQGDALARVLTGVAEPAGRLPLTLPRALSETPAGNPAQYPGIDMRAAYSEHVLVGYRGFDADDLTPAYPFGHGLSYTTFEYSDLHITSAQGDDVATISCTVQNTGTRSGVEVVQLYVGHLPVNLVTAPRQLAAFAKIRLDVGDTSCIELAVPRRAVSYFDDHAGDWVTPSGDVEVFVGASSRDLRLTGTITVR